MCKKQLSTFTNQYQLSKTLRFELKPMGETANWIKKHNIIGVKEEKGKSTLIGKDAKKAKHYKYAKKLLDNMHRLFIEDALSVVGDKEHQDKLITPLNEISKSEEYELNKDKGLQKIFEEILNHTANNWKEEYAKQMPTFWIQEIKDLNIKIANETNKKKIKGYNSAIKAIDKKLVNPLKDIKKNGCALLYSNSEAMHFLEWKVLTGEVTATFKELDQNETNEQLIPKEQLSDFLRGFHKFYSYFSGFNENRQNVYDTSGTKSTAIINRIFIDNFHFHLNNIQKWKTIKKSLEDRKIQESLQENKFDWQSELSEIEAQHNCSFDELMTIDSFIRFMNQSGIDEYNKLLGGSPALDGSRKTQGLNEFTNLCRQKSGSKRYQFPPMQEFYKQILSKSDKTFIPEFNDDHDMLRAIESFYNDTFINQDEDAIVSAFMFDTAILTNELNQDFKNIYLAKDKITSISKELTGHWGNLNSELLEKFDEKIFNKRNEFSFYEIEEVLKFGSSENRFTISESYTDNLVQYFINAFRLKKAEVERTWNILQSSGILQLQKIDTNRINEEHKGFQQVAIIKEFLDTLTALAYFVRDWQSNKQIEKIDTRNKHWYEHLNNFSHQFKIINIYNMVRNHLTKKTNLTEKLKINFENATLLDGWDRNKESDNYGILLQKDECYYLAVMTKDSNKLFDYAPQMDDTVNKLEKKTKLKQIITQQDNTGYQKINYKLLSGANKMLPKVFFSKSRSDLFKPSIKILSIRNNGLYKKEKFAEHGIENLYKWIDFCKDSLKKHPEWSVAYNFKFSQTQTYTSVDQFYKEVEQQGYSITFENIKESYINEKVENGELYLFQIYNKDFSKAKKKKGTDNLHTIYWKGLFDSQNLENTILKLNGSAEIFFRPSSIKYSKDKLKAGHHAEELKDKFDYPIIKDKRYTQNKFFFHCPITLNAGLPSIPTKFNDKVRAFVKNNECVNIIGIDRGEKHLLYYSVINQKGEIIEQGSLNSISNGFIPQGETNEREINYHQKLDKIEQNRDKARKSWSTIENIKEMKAGYLSQVVHKLSQLIIKHNAIVVLEDLNMGFKRGRFGVEKQVYQKFEKALIDKLNYLVFKKETAVKAGGFLNAFQLTNKFESFQKMGKQSGILFYTTAAYTSTTDPITGFLKNVYPKYHSVEKSIEFWKTFDSIIYNKELDRFEFTYTLGKISNKSMFKEKEDNDKKLFKRTWTVCSCVTRSRYIKTQATQSEIQKQETTNQEIGNKGVHEIFSVTNKIKDILKQHNIDLTVNYDLKKELVSRIGKEKAIHSAMIYAFNSIMTMRVTDSTAAKGSKENDFILSPVEPFFDSRYASPLQPENGDANGAYNIARKGICILENINTIEDVNKAKIAISKQQWQNYAQK